MLITGIAVGVCVLIHMLAELACYLGRDNHFNQNIRIRTGGHIGEGTANTDGLLLAWGRQEQETTVIRSQEHVTSSFSGIYIRLYGLETGECYDAYMENQLEVGRAAQDGKNILILNEPMVSKRHCLLFRRGNQIMIQDLGSTNHTYVNDFLVEGAIPISHGDKLCLGTCKYQFQCFYQG